MKKNMRYFFKGSAAAVLAALALLSISCANEDNLEPHEISELYGYTYYGNITTSGGNTLMPSLILYNDERVDWNMSVNDMDINQFYYYAVKNAVNNYTLYWFGGADYGAMLTRDKSKAVMTVQFGINSAKEAVILLTGDDLTGLGKMQNTRVTMKMQESIPRNTNAPAIKFDPSIQDVEIKIPDGASEADWGGLSSYDGTFDYLVGPEGKVSRGHGSCGKDSGGNVITPKIGIDKGASDTHTVTLKVHRFAYTQQMTIEAFDIVGVKVFQAGSDYYLKFAAASVTAKRFDGSNIILNDVTVDGELKSGKLTLRVSFKPGIMPLAIVEVFKSK